MKFNEIVALDSVIRCAKEYADRGSLLHEQAALLEKTFEYELAAVRNSKKVKKK